MDDLISRQAAIEALDRIFDNVPMELTTEILRLRRELRGLHAADVVEVVRCKDCKHYKTMFCKMDIWHKDITLYRADENDFCSYGEKKDGQSNYQGAPLSFGFCESDDMWQSLYGETYEVAHIDTDDDFYCGYAKRRTDE